MTIKSDNRTASLRRLYGETRDKLLGHDFERTIRIERQAGAEGQPNTYAAALSSELPVRRWFGDEILVHSAEAVNMERAANGLSLLINHDVDQLAGRVAGIKLDGDRLRGELVFDAADAEGAKWLGRVERGFAGDVSIRYTIDDYEIVERKDEEPEFRVTRWTPLEVSVVTVPADHSVGIGRSHQEGTTMTVKKSDDGVVDTAHDDTINVVSLEVGRARGLSEGTTAERQRIAGVEDLFASLRQDMRGELTEAMRRDAIANGWSIDQTRAKLFAAINSGQAGAAEPIGSASTDGAGRGINIKGDANDEVDKLEVALSRAVSFRGGLLDQRDKEVRREMGENEFAGMRLPEMAREYLRRVGISTRGMDQVDVVRVAMNPSVEPEGRRVLIGQGTTSFTNLLANTANKALGMGYDEAQGNWRRIVRIGSVPDFKANDRPNLSAFSSLDTVPEGGEYKHGKFSDKKETLTALKKGKLFAVTREAILNDDVGAFTRIPRAMGAAADRSVNVAVFGVLTGNPVMNEDSTALFDAGHSNLGTSGTISTTTWGEMRKIFGIQTDPSGNATLSLMPKILVCPLSVEPTALVLATSVDDPIGNTNAKGGARSPNIYKGTFEVVADGLLDATSTAVWYAMADPSVYDTIEVAFVGGRQEPYLEAKDGWNVDGVEYKVRHEFACGPLDFRTMGRNAGV